MFKRFLDLTPLLETRSLFLLGPRQTGKSSLLRQPEFQSALLMDLLDPIQFRKYATTPEVLRDEIRSFEQKNQKKQWIIIDEIQKLPELLDEVHRLMELHKKVRFILTGSSARKLRQGGVNLLGGRAHRYLLHPLVYPEWRTSQADYPHLTWMDFIQWGGLPSIITSSNPKEDLLAYLGLYLQEEIQSLAGSSMMPFSRFLNVVGACHGEQIHFAAVASDAQIPLRMVRDYYVLLQDTLMGSLLPSYKKTKIRKAMTAEKFYFFDVGIANALLNRWSLAPGSPEFGRAFEHFIFCELKAAQSYFRSNVQLSYWRSTSQLEVDFILEYEDHLIAIEVKAKNTISTRDLKGLFAFSEDFPRVEKYVVCLEPGPPRITSEGVEILPLEEFLKRLWNLQEGLRFIY